MQDDVAMSTAARELGLRPKMLELAVQIGEIRSEGGAKDQRRVPREELARLKESAGFPQSFEERLRVVDAGEGAELLGICTARFARLARGGCFSPVRFYVNRYRAVVWLYLARELEAFAGRRPELLTGAVPRGLRMLLSEGVDYRPRHWRGRRVGQLCRQASGRPWEVAAARSAVLTPEVLRVAVPDVGERALLQSLRPELMVVRGESSATREVAEGLCVAEAEDEILWHRLMLEAELQDARAAQHQDGEAGAVPEAAGPPVRCPAPRGAGEAHSGGGAESGSPLPLPGSGTVMGSRPGATPGAYSSGTGSGVPGNDRPEAAGCKGRAAGQDSARAADPSVLRRRAHLLNRMRGPRRGAAWWRREGELRRPAF
ncbi:hypothetical protein H181DRAFT_00403 [Streptomyces sp. WMMB 714]|uniref:DUF6397 family protein n=1 Tax=Streptomyces sp. WMMB 714 TaxID=1286822 RepID=UPI000698AFA9|nr:DUF6397 family protein [Streptomyces sp. WMMB 714]SCK08794.1 hypothetical protein H181DRAFT_00403 [Streptomyces sp. WMMB 714]